MPEQEIRVGQVWRRKKTGKHIRIDRAVSQYDDWHWVGEDYKGTGVSYGSYIRRDCELVNKPESTDGSGSE